MENEFPNGENKKNEFSNRKKEHESYRGINLPTTILKPLTKAIAQKINILIELEEKQQVLRISQLGTFIIGRSDAICIHQ